MEIYVTNTAHGLVPNYDTDYEEKKKLKIGQTYKCQITVPRNYQFLKKYFALLRCAWEYTTDIIKEKYYRNNFSLFRKQIEITAGCCEPYWSFKLNMWVETHKSISFNSMSSEEFNALYDRVKSVLYATVLRGISEEEFNNNLINF